ncbi:hypothetical protein Ddye_031457 [Dipteronia dyeriana]|uniref:Uncharacterized protein n=1 Tax=Dipteronia dyeriana TaxID=168575 RepID=A0AAD9TIC5_9ROSI|nr:hypothetical protein Ddye_031457 [Dipteronia dyeriana]
MQILMALKIHEAELPLAAWIEEKICASTQNVHTKNKVCMVFNSAFWNLNVAMTMPRSCIVQILMVVCFCSLSHGSNVFFFIRNTVMYLYQNAFTELINAR